MKKTIRLLILALLICSFLGVCVFATDQTDGNPSQERFGLDDQSGILGSHKLIVNAQSVFLYEAKSQTLMYAWNADEGLAPASFVKLMTALLVVENAELTDTVTVDRGTLNTIPSDARISKLKPGETFTVEDLLCFMLVDSGNDAAAVLAEFVSNSQTAFVDMMNARAEEIGCTNTNFMNVHGLYHEEQYMSARDTARILSVAMENSHFRDVFTRVYYTVPATDQNPQRQLASDNYLLSEDDMAIYYDKRVLGSRTGLDPAGNRCIASVSADNGMEFISVVMGCASEYGEDGYSTKVYGGYPETRELLDAGFENYKTAQILYSGQILRLTDVYDGDCQLALGSQDSVWSVLPDDVELSDLEFAYSDIPGALTAPVTQGSHVSTLRIMLKGNCIAQREVYAMNSVSAVSSPDVVVQKGISEEAQSGGSFWTVLLVILVLSVIVYLIYRLRRRKQSGAQKKRSRNHRANRRRTR